MLIIFILTFAFFLFSYQTELDSDTTGIKEKIIAGLTQPDDARKSNETLVHAILNHGWPLLSESHGKILFALDNTGNVRDTCTIFSSERKNRANKVLRIARITDLHLDTGSNLEDWMRICIKHIHEQEDRPEFLFSHIPVLRAAAFFDGGNEKSGNWQIPGAWVHIDARRIVELFHKHSNVKVGISGHIHLLDEVVYNNVTYNCNGAVSGNWWNGDYHQTPAGYALINLYEDGTFNREYVAYGWEKG
jgi:hypothetical protein